MSDAARGRRTGRPRRPTSTCRSSSSSSSCSTSCSRPGSRWTGRSTTTPAHPTGDVASRPARVTIRTTRWSRSWRPATRPSTTRPTPSSGCATKHGLTETGPRRVDRRLVAGPDQRDHRRDPPADRRRSARRVQLGVRAARGHLHPRDPRAADGVAPRPRPAAAARRRPGPARRSASRATGTCRGRPTSASSPRSRVAP